MQATILGLGLTATSAAYSSQIWGMYFATTTNEAGLSGAGFASNSPYWETNWSVDTNFNSVFEASFSGGLSYDNSGSWSGSSLCCMGADTGSAFGQTFIAPADALTSFSFLVRKSVAGHFGTFGVAPDGPFDPNDAAFPIGVGAPIYTELFEGVSAGNFKWQSFNLPLIRGREYVAYLSPAIAEPPTWVMMGIGFAGLGFAGCRRAKKAAVAPLRSASSYRS